MCTPMQEKLFPAKIIPKNQSNREEYISLKFSTDIVNFPPHFCLSSSQQIEQESQHFGVVQRMSSMDRIKARNNKRGKIPTLPLEIYLMIIKFSHLEDHKNLALTNKAFKNLIKGPTAEVVALESRKNTYGPEMPESRSGFTQASFNEFLIGKKCDDCGDRSQKPYLSFNKRWCKSCRSKATKIVSSDLKTALILNQDLQDVKESTM